MSPLRRLAAPAAVLALALTGCGGSDGHDLKGTCAAVHAEMPANLYDNDANAVLLTKVRAIVAKADDDARTAFRPFVDRLADVVATGDDDEAFVTESVDLLEAVDDLDARCRKAGARLR